MATLSRILNRLGMAVFAIGLIIAVVLVTVEGSGQRALETAGLDALFFGVIAALLCALAWVVKARA
jgi:hypothetical protein